MKKILLILLLASCRDSKSAQYVCTCEQKDKLQQFISSNVKPANNMSDEEMEDVIDELRKTGIKVICNQKIMYVDNTGNPDWSKNKLDSCETWMPYW